MKVVGQAYQAHAKGNTIMPPNGYLRFPNMEKERIIAKAAYLGGEHFNEAGLKWIASFPGNLSKGIERASATLILNSAETGRPTAVFESSIISAKRTAASAALAAQLMSKDANPKAIGIVGCGLINFETLRFLLHVFPSVEDLHLLDLSEERANQFKNKALQLKSSLEVHIQHDLQALLSTCKVIAYGTTAVKPFTDSVEGHLPDLVILHTSLRDLTENVIRLADNVVDDIDQVCSNKTSLHLTEIEEGNRDFIRTTIGDILNGDAEKYDSNNDLHIFSPFGLGILDLAVGYLVNALAIEQGVGMTIEGFLPKPWMERD
jgi:ornithine cyclodeaminase